MMAVKSIDEAACSIHYLLDWWYHTVRLLVLLPLFVTFSWHSRH